MTNKNWPDTLIILSALAAIVSAIDFVTRGDVLNIAGTQWILIATVLGIYGLYFKIKG